MTTVVKAVITADSTRLTKELKKAKADDSSHRNFQPGLSEDLSCTLLTNTSELVESSRNTREFKTPHTLRVLPIK